MKYVTVSLQSLYEKFGSDLKHGKIIKNSDENNDYYDLTVEHGFLACCDGEECEIVREYENNFLLKSVEEDDYAFLLTKEEFNVGVFY